MLRQRTALLKSAGGKTRLRGPARESMTATLDTWDAQLARTGAPLLAGRIRLVAALRPHVQAAYEAVSGGRPGEASGMSYRSSAFNNEEGFEDAPAFDTSIRALPARGYASHGESWSLALALRLASFTLLRQGHEDPVLILDDVFAELDEGRRDRLAGLVAGAEQVLITAAVPADIPDRLAGARFEIQDGVISRAG